MNSEEDKTIMYKQAAIVINSILEDISLISENNLNLNIHANIKDKEEFLFKTISKIKFLNSKIYDSEPVTYCSGCLSLKIKRLENTQTYYCGSCGNTNLEETVISIWEEKYKLRYGKDYIERDK